jgi:hypothetical protein
MKRARIELMHGSLMYRDTRLQGFDAAGGGGSDRAPRPAAPAGV